MQTDSPDAIDGANPTQQSDRISSLDILRGFAVCGILIMNIQSYSMASAIYTNPHAHGELTGVDYWVWYCCHLLADLKFMAIFSMLFGAGIVLTMERRESKGLATTWFHYRRMFWLLVIGLVHAYVIWYGDILVIYAMVGGLLYWIRRLPPFWLIAIGVTMLMVGSGLYFVSGLTMPYWSDADLAEFRQEWSPTDEQLADEVAMYRGSWMDHAPHRAKLALAFHTFLFIFYFVWRVGGLFLIGMALQKLSVLSASRSSYAYSAMVIAGFGIGMPLIASGVQQNSLRDWDVSYSFFLGIQFNYWGSLFIAMAYIGLIMLACRRGWLAWLAPVGQMALTNYLAQSVICTLIFYGHGLGQFGRFSRVEQLFLVSLILISQAVFSNLWLKSFRYGPMEWLWRSLTYWKRQPMRRATSVELV